MEFRRIEPLVGHEIMLCGPPADSYLASLELHVEDIRRIAKIASNAVKPGTEIYDIGANIGLCTLMLSICFPDNTIVAVEASPVNCSYLHANIGNNGRKNVEIIHRAVSEEAGGTLAFSHEAHSAGSGSHVQSEDSVDENAMDCMRIGKTSLDDLRASRGAPVSFCKIDVEGHEPNVLAGGKKLMTSDKPLVYMEFNSWCLNAFGGHSPAAFAKSLVKYFSPNYVENDGTIHPILRSKDLLYSNIFAKGCVSDVLLYPGNDYPSLQAMTWPQAALQHFLAARPEVMI